MTRTNIRTSIKPLLILTALATNPHGYASVASGSPERVVRMWDPRNGKRTAKLVGYTDILLSDDARYVTAPLGVLGRWWPAVNRFY